MNETTKETLQAIWEHIAFAKSKHDLHSAWEKAYYCGSITGKQLFVINQAIVKKESRFTANA